MIPFAADSLFLENSLLSLQSAADSLEQLEVVLVNAGVDPDAKSIADSFVACHKNWRLIDLPVQALPGEARNKGLSAATGEWVLFLDSDDRLDRNALLAALELIDIHPGVELLYCGLAGDSAGSDFGFRNRGDFHENSDSRSGLSLLLQFLQAGFWQPSQSAYLWKRTFLEEISARFPEQILHEDNVFTFENLSVASALLVTTTPIVIVKSRQDSITHVPTEFRLNSLYQVWKEIAEGHAIPGRLSGDRHLQLASRWVLRSVEHQIKRLALEIAGQRLLTTLTTIHRIQGATTRFKVSVALLTLPVFGKILSTISFISLRLNLKLLRDSN